MQFGRRSEKLDPDQFALAFEDVEQAVAASEAGDDKHNEEHGRVRAEKRRANRGALPAHLPRVHVTIEPEDKTCPCCNSPMHVVGEETSERLDVIPAQFRAVVTHRLKYACQACEQAVVQAPAPERLIEGGELPTEAMVASVLVSKYAWHLPLYRQSQMLAAQGLEHQAIGPGVLGGIRRSRTRAALPAAAPADPRLRQDRGRRDEGAGARPRPRPGQEWLLLGNRPGRPAMGRDRSAGHCLTYAPGRGMRARRRASRWSRRSGPGSSGSLPACPPRRRSPRTFVTA